MPYTLPRIGKALVKYFKPVRGAPPHLPGDPRYAEGAQSGAEKQSAKPGFKLLKFKKPARDPFAETKAKLQSGLELDSDLVPSTITDKAPGQWLEMVVYLLSACRKASQKMRKRVALDVYKKAALGRAHAKTRTLGSIINTTAEAVVKDEDQDEAA